MYISPLTAGLFFIGGTAFMFFMPFLVTLMAEFLLGLHGDLVFPDPPPRPYKPWPTSSAMSFPQLIEFDFSFYSATLTF